MLEGREKEDGGLGESGRGMHCIVVLYVQEGGCIEGYEGEGAWQGVLGGRGRAVIGPSLCCTGVETVGRQDGWAGGQGLGPPKEQG